MNSNTPLKYILYARKSSESEDRQMASIEDQILEMKRLAKKQGLHVVDVIRESKSAKAPGRKKFNELLSRIHKKEANAILVWKLNRLARNPIDGGQISWMLQQHIIAHIQTFGSDYKPSDNVLMMQIEFGMATQFVKDLSVSVCRGMRLKAERGWFPASQLPVGYLWEYPHEAKGGDKKIIPDPERFALIKSLWKELLSGEYNISQIEDRAFIRGLRNKKGNRFGDSFFYRLFQNEFYCGYFSWKDADGNLVRHKGKHKAMISEKEFNLVQQRFFDGPGTCRRDDEFLFRGLLRCGECNRGITAQRKLQCICRKCKYKFSNKVNDFCPKCKTKVADMENPVLLDNTYYHCSNPKRKCSQRPINEKVLEKQILMLFKAISIDHEFYLSAKEVINSYNKKIISTVEDKIALLKRDISGFERKIKNLTLLRAANEIEAEEYKELKQDLLEQIQEAECTISEIENANEYNTADKLEYLKVSENLLSRFEKGTTEVKKLLVSKFSSNLTLKDKNLYFSMPSALYDILLQYKAYKAKKQGLEPEKSLIYSQDMTLFSLPLSVGEPTGKKLEPKPVKIMGLELEDDVPGIVI